MIAKLPVSTFQVINIAQLPLSTLQVIISLQIAQHISSCSQIQPNQMGTQKVNVALIIKNPSNDEEFLLRKQTRPPKFNDPEYDSYQDSDLWDLPSQQLSPLDSSSRWSQIQIEAEDSSLLELLNGFDFDSAVYQVSAALQCSIMFFFVALFIL